MFNLYLAYIIFVAKEKDLSHTQTYLVSFHSKKKKHFLLLVLLVFFSRKTKQKKQKFSH